MSAEPRINIMGKMIKQAVEAITSMMSNDDIIENAGVNSLPEVREMYKNIGDLIDKTSNDYQNLPDELTDIKGINSDEKITLSENGKVIEKDEKDLVRQKEELTRTGGDDKERVR